MQTSLCKHQSSVRFERPFRPSDRKKNDMKPYRGTYRLKGIRRFGTITRVLIRHGYSDLLDRLMNRPGQGEAAFTREKPARPGYPSPVRIRQVLEELGPSFIKLGQLMSVRGDMFPPEYIEEFKKLQDHVPPVPFEGIRTVIETEQRRPVEEIFTEFNPECIAAASVAQVYRARLANGESAAVKVIRPGIEKKIREDVQVMYYFAEKIEKHFEVGRIIGLANLVGEFERTIFKELDMFVEAGNMERFAENFKNSDEIYIARVHWNYVSKSVLVMEFIHGVKMDEVSKIRSLCIDPKAVAMIGLRSFSRQLMDFGFFHGDPHPANTIVMRDGRVSMVDFGIIGILDEDTMMQIANLFLGFAEHDYELVMEALADAGLIDEQHIDLKAFRTDLMDISEPFYGRSLQTISVKDVYEQVMRLAFKYRIRLPRNLLLLLKTFVQTEGLGKILGSDASLLEVTRPYARRLIQRGYDARKLLRNLGRDTRTLSAIIKMMPKFTHDILKRTAEGRHRLRLQLAGLEAITQRLEKGLNRFIVGVIISASTIAGSLILNSPLTFIEVTIGGHSIPVTTLLGLAGYSIATVLGLWLIVSILRSGKI